MSNLNEPVQASRADQGYDVDDEPASVSLLDVVTWLGQDKRPIAAVTFVAALGSIAVAMLLPNVYTARTTLLAATSQQQSGSAAALAALGTLGGGLPNGITPKTPDDLYVKLLTSESVVRPLTAAFSLKERYHVPTFENLRTALPRYVRVSAEKKSGIITVEVDDQDPEFAAKLANAHATEVTKLLSRLAVSEAQQRRIFFEKQLKETNDKLVTAEQALRLVQEKSGMVVLDQQAGAIIKSVAELKARIVEREVRLRVLRTATTPQNPDVKMLSAEVVALRSELARLESSPGASDPNKTGLDIPVNKLPAAASEYVRALREVKFHESMLASMLRQFEIAKLDEAKDSPALQQVDVALPPDRKSKPARAVIVLASTFLAFALTSIFIVIRRRLRSSASEGDRLQQQAWSDLRRAWRLRGN